jgi:membrane protein
MAYYGAFCLFPLCLVLIAILGFLTRFSVRVHDARQQLVHLAREGVSPWLADQLDLLLRGVETHAGLGGPIGLAALLLGAVGIFMQLDYTFAKIWEKDPGPRGWLAAIRSALHDRLVAFLMLLGAGVLLAAVFVADVAMAAVRHTVAQLPAGHSLWHVVQWAIPIVSYTLLLSLIYKTFPRAPVRWREALTGGLAAGVVWFAGQALLIRFAIGDSYTAYGVVGSFVALMLWFYYASAVVFLGAELVRSLALESQPTPDSPASSPDVGNP